MSSLSLYETFLTSKLSGNGWLSSTEFLFLLLRPGGHVVVGKLEGVLSGIVLLDQLVDILEEAESEQVLLLGVEAQTVSGEMLLVSLMGL